MNLRRRTLLIVLLLLLATLLAIELASRWLVYPKFLDLEQEQARRNAELVIEVTNHELEVLAGKPEDWGYWDDTYKFVQDDNPEYIDSNLSQQSQLSLRVNLLGIYDTAGRKVWARAMDLKSLEEFDLDDFTGAALPAHSPFMASEDQPKTRAGLVLTSHGVMLIASTPVLRSLRTGPHMGSLMMGRLFDTRGILRIARQAGLQVSFVPHRGDSIPLPPGQARPDSLVHTPLILRADSRRTYVNTVIFSVDGKPALDLQVSTPRDISAGGRDTLRVALISTGMAGVAIALILLWQLNIGVVVPLSRLSRRLRRIGASDDDVTRLNFNRHDEIGDLAAEFDRMLDRLTDARQRLRQESYRSGASEMAGGIVRDIGNSLSPIQEQIGQPLRLLDQAHTSSMQSLVRELAQPGLSHHRQTELLAVLQDLLGEQAGLLSEARGELRSLRRRLEQMQEKVTEHSRYMAAPGTLAPVMLAELLDLARRRLPEGRARATDIRIADSVQQVPAVAAVREVLLQVLTTLIGQLASLGDGEHPLLRISAGSEIVNDCAVVFLHFDDERPLAEARRLAAEFTQPAPAHPEGSSLAWTENAVSAMGGRLTAEASEGYGGLRVELRLPRAK
jgi:sensor domain CHASE-containing protein